LQKIFCDAFSAKKAYRIFVELPNVKFGGIMGNMIEYVKDNHPQKKPKKLLDLAKDILRRKHYSIRTEEAYISWMIRYIHFHNKRHPKDMGVPEIEAFLTHLAVEENVAGLTQNQATIALHGLIAASIIRLTKRDAL
jgi:hypothetical protein